MCINDIDLDWGESAFVWVRPAPGTTWRDICGSNSYENGEQDNWRPAKVSGFVRGHWAYGTINDPRTVFLINSSYGYEQNKFEFGGLLTAPDEPQHEMSSKETYSPQVLR